MKYFVQAPVRLSLFGGGSDVGQYAKKYGGVCINMAINIRQEFTFDTDSVGLRVPPNADPKFYQAFLDGFGVKARIEQNFNGFIHGGLGTSASAAVCMVYALSKLTGKELTKQEVAEKAWDIEVNKIGLFGGRQDQYCATFGGMNLMEFGKEVKVMGFENKISGRLANDILLFDTGIKRKDSKLQENLKKTTLSQKLALDVMVGLARDACDSIYKGDTRSLGVCLDQTWRYKKQSNNVTTPEIDSIYRKAKILGAYGGKLCGSGGGGYMLFIVPKQKQKYFKDNIGLKWVDFEIDRQGVNGRFL